MKSVLLLLAVFHLFVFNTVCQDILGNDTIFASTFNNSVTIWDMDARRNCASSYIMQIEEENQQITWVQRDTGDYAYCFCSFDYSITFGPLNPGTYSVNVYYTEPEDTTRYYVGSTSFIIESPMLDSLSFFNPFSSDCGGMNLGWKEARKKKSGLIGQNFPNPFHDQTSISFSTIPNKSGKILIMNTIGEIVRGIPLPGTGRSEITIYRQDEYGKKLPAGIYFYFLDSQIPPVTHKMIIMD